MLQKTCSSYLNCTAQRKTLFQKRGYPVLECQTCGHRFVEIANHDLHLSTVYSDDYFFEGKDGYPNYLNSRDILYEQGLRYANILSKYSKPGKLLDVGSAAGFIMKGFEKNGWQCVGVEPNETMASYGREKLHLNITTGSIESFNTNERFDLIIMIQVIGHVYDLDRALDNVSTFLKPGGLVLVESWNCKSLVARLLGKAWHEYIPPSVVHWFSDKTLGVLFKAHGLRLIKKGYPVKKIVAEHAFSVLEGQTNHPVLKKIITSMNIFIRKFALIYPLLDVKYYLFRKE